MRTLRKTGSSARKTGKQSSRPATVHGNEGQAHRLTQWGGSNTGRSHKSKRRWLQDTESPKETRHGKKGAHGELHESWKLLHREDQKTPVGRRVTERSRTRQKVCPQDASPVPTNQSRDDRQPSRAISTGFPEARHKAASPVLRKWVTGGSLSQMQEQNAKASRCGQHEGSGRNGEQPFPWAGGMDRASRGPQQGHSKAHAQAGEHEDPTEPFRAALSSAAKVGTRPTAVGGQRSPPSHSPGRCQQLRRKSRHTRPG